MIDEKIVADIVKDAKSAAKKSTTDARRAERSRDGLDKRVTGAKAQVLSGPQAPLASSGYVDRKSSTSNSAGSGSTSQRSGGEGSAKGSSRGSGNRNRSAGSGADRKPSAGTDARGPSLDDEFKNLLAQKLGYSTWEAIPDGPDLYRWEDTLGLVEYFIHNPR